MRGRLPQVVSDSLDVGGKWNVMVLLVLLVSLSEYKI